MNDSRKAKVIKILKRAVWCLEGNDWEQEAKDMREVIGLIENEFCQKRTMTRSGRAVVYHGLIDTSIIMQDIPYGLPEQSILVSEFAHKETKEGKAVFEISQSGNQILVNGETISALCCVLKHLLKQSEEGGKK